MANIYHFHDLQYRQSFPVTGPVGNPNFLLFLAADFTDIKQTVIADFALWLANRKCIYICVWGPDCKRAHNIINEICTTTNSLIITTEHSDKTLDEALSFFVSNIILDEDHVNAEINLEGICVDNNMWHTAIKAALSS